MSVALPINFSAEPQHTSKATRMEIEIAYRHYNCYNALSEWRKRNNGEIRGKDRIALFMRSKLWPLTHSNSNSTRSLHKGHNIASYLERRRLENQTFWSPVEGMRKFKDINIPKKNWEQKDKRSPFLVIMALVACQSFREEAYGWDRVIRPGLKWQTRSLLNSSVMRNSE